MNHDNERKAFEAWFESRYDAHFMQFALDLDLYVDKHTQTCWEAWQASANREGYKLVPVETLEESLSWASIAKWDSPSKESDLEIEKHEKIIEAMIGARDDH